MRPGIVVEDRDFDDAGLQCVLALACGLLDGLELAQHVVGFDDVRVILDLKGRIGGADFGYALDLGLAHGSGNRERFEKRVERHGFVALDEDVLVTAK
jgi:hypothetical protein